MKIVFLGNFGVDFSSETHHKKSLEALGHQVVPLQENQASTEQVYMEASKADMFIWVHTHGWQTLSMTRSQTMEDVLKLLKGLGVPTVTYHLDLWFGLKRQNDLDQDPIYKNIEYFFTCDKKMADWFNENTTVKGRYLPAGVFQDDMELVIGRKKTHDVIFVGSRGYHPEWGYRPKLIDWLKETYGSRFTHYGGDGAGVVRGADLTKLYNETKVVVGDSLCINFDYPYYWSDRLYETAGRGGFQIFPQITGIQDQFSTYDFKTDDGGFWDKPAAPIELVTYELNNFGMLKQRIDYWLEHDQERDEIRYNAYQRTRRDHTYLSRWQHIIQEVTSDKS